MSNTFQELRNAENTLNNIKYKVEDLKDKNCRQNSSSTYCDNLLRKKYYDKAKKKLESSTKDVNLIMKRLISIKRSLKSEEDYESELNTFYKEKKDYYNLKQKNLEKLEKDGAISNRMTNFYNKKTDNVLDFSFYLKMLYWILFLVIIVLLIGKKQYSNVKYWPMILALLLFPIIFLKSLIFQVPIANKQLKIPSIIDYLYENFEHFKVDNIYLISFIMMGGLILLYTLISKLPFNMDVLPN
jgi:hypothetical protein